MLKRQSKRYSSSCDAMEQGNCLLIPTCSVGFLSVAAHKQDEGVLTATSPKVSHHVNYPSYRSVTHSRRVVFVK